MYLLLDLGSDLFIRVEEYDPVVGSLRDRKILLITKIPEFSFDESYLRKSGGKLLCIICAERIHYNDLIRERKTFNELLDHLTFVQGNGKGGNFMGIVQQMIIVWVKVIILP